MAKLPDTFKLVEGNSHGLAAIPNAKKRRVDLTEVSSDGSSSWQKAFLAACVPGGGLPSLDTLPGFVSIALPVKIGLTEEMLARVRSTIRNHVCDKLFVEDSETPCYNLWEDAILRVLRPTQWARDSREINREYHRAWGVVVRELFAAVFVDNSKITTRDDQDKHATNFAFELDDVGVFYGEEGVPTWRDDSLQWFEQGIAVPIRRLRDELRWSNGDKVPYIIGYAATGYKCELHAMHSSDMMDVKMTKIGEYDTRDANDRFEFALALLHLCRLFPAIAERSSERLEWKDVAQPDGVVVTLRPTSVVRDYTSVKSSYRGVPFQECLATNEYFSVTNFQLSHTEILESASICGFKFMFTPRGFAVLPQSLDELFLAIECVLMALVEIHEMGWMHRNISWSNVLQYRDASRGWFLTDFVHAARSPQQCPSDVYFGGAEHAPELSTKGSSHTTAVDLWSVGWLLAKWKAPPGSELWRNDKSRLKLMRDMLASEPNKRPTAEEALATLKELRLHAVCLA